MSYILDNIPPVDNFPKDYKLRVVWAYGALLKNLNDTTNVPNVKIMLREILDDGSISDESIFIKISVAQLDIVRYMTIWKGCRRVNEYWKVIDSDKTNIEFNFDFEIYKPESISLGEKKPNSTYTYFPQYKYNLGIIHDKMYYYHFINSTFTKLVTPNGISVLVPSLEFLTSTYVPQEQKLRNQLLQYPIEYILEKYIKNAHVVNDEYHMEFKEKKTASNEVFLSYAKFNNITIQRLAKLRNSLEVASKYPDRYPEVLPYHPTEISIRADGIWLDQETFFAYRINGYTLPVDNKIVSQEIVYKSEKPEREGGNTYTKYPQEIDDYDIPLGNETRPHRGNGSLHIISEVSVMNINNCNIEYSKEEIETTEATSKERENTEDIETLSSGEPNSAEESKGTGRIKIDPKKESSSPLNQSNVLNMIKEALLSMKESNFNLTDKESDMICISDILFVNENCNLQHSQVKTQFSKILKTFGKKTTAWVKYKANINGRREFMGYRNYMLIKIILNNGKFMYLFEIDRKNQNEGFLGLLFNLGGNSIGLNHLVPILNKVMKQKGVFRKESIDADNFITFKHYEKNGSMIENIKNTIKKAYTKKLFQ